MLFNKKVGAVPHGLVGQAPITINGTEYSKTDTDAGVTIASKKVTLADDKFYDQGWNHISINASGATANTLFTTFHSSGSGNVARYYIDNLVVTSVQ